MPPVYAISLARAQERRANIKQRLDALGVAYEIVDAVDGETLDLSQYAHRLRQGECRARHGFELAPDEIGCFLSHHNLWRRIAEGGDEHALIVEDDAIFDDDFAAVIGELLQSEWLWDVVLLSSMPRPIDRVLCELRGGRKLARFKRRPYTAAAYLISRTGAAKLRDYCEDICGTVDFMYAESWKNGVAFYCVTPPPAGQGEKQTTMSGTRGRPDNRTVTERLRGSVWRKTDRLQRAFFILTTRPQKR